MEEEIENQYQWRPIHFSGSHYYNTHERKHYYSGEEYGIQWFIYPDTDSAEWVVTATDGKRTYTERFVWIHEPVFGIDVTDAERIDEILGKLIEKCRKRNIIARLFDWFKNFCIF